MVNGSNFGASASVYWIGMPDSAATDTVIYMFDHTVACTQITTAGWDAGLVAGTQILELKMVGKTPMVYPTTTAATHIPAAGESASSYTVAAPTANDIVATGGSVTLAAIGQPTPSGMASGSFHLTFPNGSLDGAYDAPYCANGREP